MLYNCPNMKRNVLRYKQDNEKSVPSNVVTTEAPKLRNCYDMYTTTCPHFATKSSCQRSGQLFKVCCKSCSKHWAVTTATTTRKPTTAYRITTNKPNCYDKRKDCKFWKDTMRSSCSEMWMEHYCCETCDVIKPVTNDKFGRNLTTCKDKAASCYELERRGYCTYNQYLVAMRNNCPKSCNVC